MKYDKVVKGTFIERPNRFIARVEIEGKTETVHVKNTGRCRELLIPGAEVYLSVSDNPARKIKTTGHVIHNKQPRAIFGMYFFLSAIYSEASSSDNLLRGVVNSFSSLYTVTGFSGSISSFKR